MYENLLNYVQNKTVQSGEQRYTQCTQGM